MSLNHAKDLPGKLTIQHSHENENEIQPFTVTYINQNVKTK
jgi:hypothetical protein